MALIFESTRGLRACPDELIRDGVAVFGGDVDGEMGKAAGDFMSPFFEFFAVGIIFDPADHEVR